MAGPYPQRTDLAVATPKSQTYGDASDSRRRQQAIPMGNPAPIGRPRPPLTPLSAPTQTPDEPITAGAPFGAGAGPEILSPNPIPATGGRDDLILRLRAIGSQFPTPALLGLIAELETPDG